jgi:inner membrane protein
VQGPSHLIISWFAAESVGLKSPRERRIVALSGLAPDIDVLAYLGAIVYFGFDKDLAFEHVWAVVHHRYTHGMGFVFLTGIFTFIVANRGIWTKNQSCRQALRVAILSMFASIVHVFCDVVGGGPTWPVYPLWPISDFGWAAQWSWTLADWPNTVILLSCLGGMMLYAKMSGYSPLESINYKLDRWFVNIIQTGSSIPHGEENNADLTLTSGKKMMRIRLYIYLILILLIIAVLAPLGFQIDQLNFPKF